MDLTQDSQIQFKWILEASLEQLVSSSMNNFPLFTEVNVIYRNALIAYLRSDLALLESYLEQFNLLINSNAQTFNYNIIFNLVKIRIGIRKKNILATDIRIFTDNFKSEYSIIQSEIYFVAALAYDGLARHSEAKYYYDLAAPLFYSEGALKRSLIANFNSVAASSKIDPYRNYTVDYQILIEKAKALKVEILVGIGYNNISREYQLLGALNTALKYVNLAIQHLYIHYPGSINYYLALIQRCHLYLESQQWRNAFTDFDEIHCSPFLEIKKSAEVLTYFMNTNSNMSGPLAGQRSHIQSDLNKLTFSWKERLNQYLAADDTKLLSETEEQLIQLLAEQPLTTHELIEKIYGNKIDFNSGHIRVRTLLTRLRKKKPDLVLYQNGKYILNNYIIPYDHRIKLK